LTFTAFAEVPVYAAALVVTLFVGRILYSHRLTSYRIARSALLSVYVLIVLLMLLDFYRVGFGTMQFIAFYFPLSSALGLSQACLLVAAGVGMYARPSGTLRSFASDIVARPRLLLLFSAFVALSAIAVLFSVLLPTGHVTTVVDFASNTAFAAKVSQSFDAAFGLLYLFFILLPVTLMLVASRKVADPRLKASMQALAVVWGVVSLNFVVSDASKWLLGFDYSGFMYLSNAVIFGFAVSRFARAAALAGFVKAGDGAQEGIKPDSGGSATETVSSMGNVLLIVDPASSFEAGVSQIVDRLLAGQNSVFLFTASGSRLDRLQLKGVRKYLMTSKVSFVKPTEDPAKVLLPEDSAILLDTIEKTYTGAKGGAVAIVFDSLSDVLMTRGFENTYKFLKQAIELGSLPNVSAYYLILKNAHDQKTTNVLEAQFSSHMVVDDAGLRTVR
jgi:hypothetical protein